MTDAQRSYLRGKRYETEKKVEGASIGNTNAKKQLDKSYPVISTAKKIGGKTGVSEGTIKNDAKFARAVDEVRETEPELAQRVIEDKW